MRDQVKAFVASVARVLEVPGPVVEVGALQTPGQEGFADLRPLFPGREFVGIDLVEGPGVDRIEDVHALGFADASLGTLLAVDSLEHVADPQQAVAEMHRVLAPGGVLIVGTPFAFPIHYHPDFTRFTPEGMARLLSAFTAVAVCSLGDAQSPHTVVAVARKDGDPKDFQARVARVVRDWEATAPPEALVVFRPVESVLRRDQLFAPGVSVRRDSPREDTFECSAAGLSRVDLRLAADGTGPPSDVRLTLHPERADAPPVVEQLIPGRSLGEPRWIACQFPPLPDSGGRRYVLRLRVEHADAAVTVFTLPDGRLVLEAYRDRPLVPDAAVPGIPAGDAALVHRLHALSTQLRGLERQVAALRALLEEDTSWWRRLLSRGRPPA